MEKKFMVILFVFALVVGTQKAVAISGQTGNSTFEIVQFENLNLGKESAKMWSLVYDENKSNLVTIVLQRKTNCNEYIVRSKFFEITYTCSPEGFGVKQLKTSSDKKYKGLAREIINKQQLKKQRILTSSHVNDETALGLIASYLPDLINVNYKHVL
jgi:hypothetical protein